MKKLLILILSFSINYISFITAQIDTSWVKRFNGPLSASDAGSKILVDENGFVYVGSSISKTPGFTDAAVIKYSSDGDTLWLRYYINQFNNGSTLHDMQLDNNGNIIITGQCGGTSLADYFTIKFDTNGNTLWTERYDEGDMDASQAMIVDDTGNIFITGTSWKIYQSNNFLTIKYSPAGDTLWSYLWAGTEDAFDIAKDIELDSYGNVVVAGTTDWHWGTIDYVTIKLNPAGDTAWVRKYDSPEQAHDYLKALVIDNQDNIYVTGDIYKTGGNHNIVTIKYNVYGDTVWTRRYNGTGNGDDVVTDMVIDTDGNIYLAGTSFVSGNGIDCLTMKYNSDGVLMWEKTYAEYSYHPDGANSLALDNSGNVYVTGSAATSSSNIAYLTIKYDNDGNEKWVTKYDGPGYNGQDIASSVFVDNSGYVYITGSSAGVTTGNDIATIKYSQAPNDVDENSDEIPTEFLLSQNYPNPFNPSTKIKYSIPSITLRQAQSDIHVSLKVFDVLGNEIETLVNEEKPTGTYEVTWYAQNLPSGVYFYQLKAVDPSTGSGQSFISTRKMILLK
ncbi:MAG: SBBP repeat-containing protein [Ignavibacteriaceae bacterium]|jgi:uncharacterized delta-60 repeat protein|nr:SBBP repeat-containing protein [Ignavibacteriaceae bacterium]